MEVVRLDLVPNGPGSVNMKPVDSDDLWSVYNLIAVRDSESLRETTGGRDTERVTLKLEIKVEAIDYDKEGSVCLAYKGKEHLGE